MEKIFFTITAKGQDISTYVTKRNEIMIESCSGENEITATEIEDLAGVSGFNHCFSTPTKREFAESCHFNNILITKYESIFDKDGEYLESKEIDSVYLSELRKSKSKLNKFIGA